MTMPRTMKKGSSGLALIVPAATVIISLFAIGAVASRGLRGARRELEAPVAAALPEASVESPRLAGKTASARERLIGFAKTALLLKDSRTKKRTPRSVIGALTFLSATICLSLLATGGSYALWNGAVAVKGGTLNTGTIGLTINGASSYTLPLPTSKLAPGQSVTATATFANGGSVPVSAFVSSTSLSTNTNGLASYLTLTVAPVASVGACVAGVSGGTSAALASFNTTSAPYAMPAGSSKLVCFVLTLSNTAPVSVEGGATTFSMNVLANQVRP
jgi:hypothetical protein